MLDLDPGILLPKDLKIGEYVPNAKLDVIEVMIRDSSKDEVISYPCKVIDLKEFSTYGTKCAIKYDNPKFLGSPICKELMQLILKYNAERCLIHYIHIRRDRVIPLFWALFDGKSHRLWEIMAAIGSCIDHAWLFRLVSKERNDCKSSRESLENVFKWMSQKDIFRNIHLMKAGGKICIQVRGLDMFVYDMLLNPSQIVEEFILDSIKGIPNGNDMLMASIDKHLKNDTIMSDILNCITSGSRWIVSYSEIYKLVLSHPDMKTALPMYTKGK